MCIRVRLAVVLIAIDSFYEVGCRRGDYLQIMLMHEPDLLQLLEFPGKTKSFSIASEIAVKYKQFIFHLNDGRGAKVDAIARKHGNDSEQINIEILQRWLAGEGRDVSWRTLVEVLNSIGLRQLASDIRVKRV